MPDLPWFVYLMLLAPLGLVLVAAAWKSLQIRAARQWPSAPGKVVVSNAEVRDIQVIDSEREGGHRTEQRNFANIVYEYAVAGKKLRHNRVSIGEDRGDFEVAETIAKYPAGAVVTVYYNPLHPNEAVLERDLPKGIWGCLGIGTAIVLAIVFGSAFGLHHITDFVSGRLSDPHLAVLVVALGAFGFAIGLFGVALQRQASLAKRWPQVPGTIRLSAVEQYRTASEDNASSGQVMYQRKVNYAYRYNNLSYTRMHSSFASNSATDSGWMARKFKGAYRDGAPVKVYVNPANPAEATLDPRAGFVWVIWICVAGFWTAAYWVATHG